MIAMIDILFILSVESDYDFSEFDYDEDPKKKKKDELDSSEENVSFDDDWEVDEGPDSDSDY